MIASSVSAVLCACWVFGAAAANPCSNGSFEQLGADGFPVDWSPVGSSVEAVSETHTGTRSLRMVRTTDTTTAETGLNRTFGSASQPSGAMIEQLKGGIDFWYQARSAEDAELCVYAIPMNADAVEKTGLPRAKFSVPPHHIGDGQWHRGRLKYDYAENPQVRWIQFAARIVGRAGDWLLDDVSYVDQVGELLSVSDIQIEEDQDLPGEVCTVRARIVNAGDAQATNVRATLELPAGLVAEPIAAQFDRLGVDRAVRSVWKVRGPRRESCRLTVAVRSGDLEDRGHLDLVPSLAIRSFGPTVPVAGVDQTAVIECELENAGHVIVANAVGQFSLGAQTDQQTMSAIPPGRTAVLRASLKPSEQTPRASVGVRVSADAVQGELEAHSELIVGAATTLPAEVGRLNAAVEPDYAILENSLVRLAFRRAQFGFGPGELAVASDGAWKTVAWLPRLSRLVTRDSAGNRIERIVYATQTPEATAGDPAGLRFAWTERDADGNQWTVGIVFGLAEWSKEITVQYELSCAQAAQLLAFDGPMLYAVERDRAIFPGLEWLAAGEASSNSLDISEDHPDRVRYVVHPNAITIPAVGMSSAAATVGLLWDVRQRWDDNRDRPSVAFASPDRFQNQRSHLVGLFLPTVPEFVDRNQREAARPYALTAGRKLCLAARLVADPDTTDPITAIERWIAWRGLPDPAPLPHASYEREIEFSMQAYLQSLWQPGSQQWWTSKGNLELSSSDRPRAFIADLMLGALMARDPALARRCRSRAEEVRALVGGEPRLDYQRFPNRADLAFANPSHAAALLAERRTDGSWRFNADQQHQTGPFAGLDYYRLGPPDALEVGTCARNAYEVLRYARIAGDHEVYQRMLNTLALMSRFQVPRAAQVWEVPVHAPDILAAADAVDAYVEAYRIAGDRRWLAEAVRWAKDGLPFIYLWSDPDKPYLLGASIPVFGATWRHGSWFARPVQWNGLRYATALLQLAEYDDSLPWRKVAEIVIRSAIHQQDPQGENIALWPDSIGAIDGVRSPWLFGPNQILMAVWKLLGRDQEPVTTIIGAADRRVHVSTVGRIESAVHRGTVISIDVSYPEGEQGVVLISNVTRPDSVSLDGRALQERIDIEQGDDPSWRYDAGNAFLAVRVPQSGAAKIRADGVIYREVKRLPYPVEQIAFDFNDSAEGWLPANDISELFPKGEGLFGRVSGPDPYLVRPLLRVAGDRAPALRLGLRVTAGSGGQLFWSTEASPGFDEQRSIRFSLIPDGRFHEYRLELGQHPDWKGQIITGLRLDPTGGVRSGEFSIDFLRAAPVPSTK